MPGVVPRFKEGPRTYTVSVPVVGGQLVVFDPSETGKVRPADAESTVILGVAATDARPPSDSSQEYTTPYGAIAHDASGPPETVAVHWFGNFMLQADGAIAPGDTVQPAANGRIAKGSGGTVIGLCVNPEGAASGERAEIRLQLLGPAAPGGD